MKWKSSLIVAALTMCALSALRTTAQQTPTTQATTASTQPATCTVRGTVKIATSFGSGKQDLSRVVIFLASDPALDVLPRPTTRATVAQHNKAFVPNFVVVPRGTDVEFPNYDDYDHNVFSRSAAAPAFDLDRYPKGQSKTRTFDKLGVVQVFCNIHPQMRAVIYVTPNQFNTRASADGNFELAQMPPGKYDLVAWHERCEEQRQPIEVRAGEPIEVAFTLKESRGAAANNSPADQRGSYGVERGLGVKRERLNLPVVTESHPAPPDTQP